MTDYPPLTPAALGLILAILVAGCQEWDAGCYVPTGPDDGGIENRCAASSQRGGCSNQVVIGGNYTGPCLTREEAANRSQGIPS